MLAKLLSLLLHAKSGAISGVFLLGATGALVTVSAFNGVTTITVTQASASPSASGSVSPSASPSASPFHQPSSSPSSSPSGSPKAADACSDQAKANALQVQRVDKAFAGFHGDLMKLRGQRSVVTIETADVLLKQIRQAAVKAIHATLTCKHDDDEDEADEDESHDAAAGTTSLNTDREDDEDHDSDHHVTSTVTFSGSDPKAIADQAIAAMQAAFGAAKNAPASSPRPSHSPEPSHSPRVPQGSHSPAPEHHD